MKKLLAVLLMLSLLATFALAEDDLLATVQARGTLIVGTEGEWAPWTYHDPATNELVGFDVEVAKAIAEKLGVTATFTEAPWDDLLAALAPTSKRIDIMANGMDVTEERKGTYDFSIPYCYNYTALIVKGDNTEITSYADLAGKKTTNSIGSSYATLAEAYGATVTPVETLAETIDLLLRGSVDATLNSLDSYNDYVSQHPDANIKVVALSDQANAVAIPLRKGEETATLRAAIDQAIEELRAEGVLAELSVKYFGEDITSVPEE